MRVFLSPQPVRIAKRLHYRYIKRLKLFIQSLCEQEMRSCHSASSGPVGMGRRRGRWGTASPTAVVPMEKSVSFRSNSWLSLHFLLPVVMRHLLFLCSLASCCISAGFCSVSSWGRWNRALFCSFVGSFAFKLATVKLFFELKRCYSISSTLSTISTDSIKVSCSVSILLEITKSVRIKTTMAPPVECPLVSFSISSLPCYKSVRIYTSYNSFRS